MTRGNRDDEEEAASDSDTDDVDHKGEKTNKGTFVLFWEEPKRLIRFVFQPQRRVKRGTLSGTS